MEERTNEQTRAIFSTILAKNKFCQLVYKLFKDSGMNLREWSPKVQNFRPPLLSEEQKHVVKLYLHTLDRLNFPASKGALKSAIMSVGKLNQPPSKEYVWKL